MARKSLRPSMSPSYGWATALGLGQLFLLEVVSSWLGFGSSVSVTSLDTRCSYTKQPRLGLFSWNRFWDAIWCHVVSNTFAHKNTYIFLTGWLVIFHFQPKKGIKHWLNYPKSYVASSLMIFQPKKRTDWPFQSGIQSDIQGARSSEASSPAYQAGLPASCDIAWYRVPWCHEESMGIPWNK